MKIFDVHVHIFPDAIAERAVNAIGSFYEHFNMECDGRLDTAIRAMDEAGITRCAAHSVATTGAARARLSRPALPPFVRPQPAPPGPLRGACAARRRAGCGHGAARGRPVCPRARGDVA